MNKKIKKKVTYVLTLYIMYTSYNELGMKDALTDFVFVIFIFLIMKRRANYIQI